MSVGTETYRVTQEDHARISQAIREAEKRTSGEVIAVVAHQSDDYFFVAGFMAALWSLTLGCLIALLSPYFAMQISLSLLAAAQLASLISCLLLFRALPGFKMIFVPRSVSYKRASNNAVRQFLARGIHTTEDRTGVLIFVSIAEHYAEVVADEGINRKVDQKDWDDMVGDLVDHARNDRLADGFVSAIARSGEILGRHFPVQDKQVNELDDRLIEI